MEWRIMLFCGDRKSNKVALSKVISKKEKKRERDFMDTIERALFFKCSKGKCYLQMRGRITWNGERFPYTVRFCAKQSLQDRVVIDTALSCHPRLYSGKKLALENADSSKEGRMGDGRGGEKCVAEGILRYDDAEACSNIPPMHPIRLRYFIHRMIHAAHAWRTADARFPTSAAAIWQAFLLAMGR